MDIYCLPPAGGRIRSQGNYYCVPPAGVLNLQNKVINAPPTASHKIWADGWAEREVYRAYEVKNKREKLRCHLLHREENFFFYI